MTGEILRPNGRPVQLNDLGFSLVSNNLSARVETFPGSAPGTRSGGSGLTPPVLRSAEVRELGTAVLQDDHPEREQEKQVDLLIPAGGPEDGRLLIYIDEAGAISFHLPQSDRQPPPGVRAGREGVLRFTIPLRRPEPATKAAPVRGVGGMVAKQVLKVVGWKVAGETVGQVGPALVRRWEAAQRPMRVLGPTNLFQPQAAALAGPIPAGGRSLLFIHGTFSRIATAFQGIPADAEFMNQITSRYGDRIFGFDHPTLATGVASNIMQLYENLAPGQHTFDIICHSRGGLVARALRDLNQEQLQERFAVDAERGNYEAELVDWGGDWQIPDGVQVTVDRILFVATPNNGTVLAQPDFLQKYLEIMMTATNLLPDIVDIGLDAVLTVAKLLVSQVMPALPGLDDQKPGGDFIKLLNQTPGPHDAAIEANYEPPAGLQAVMQMADRTVDLIFEQLENDLVVPTKGVSDWPGGDFQQPRQLTFSPAAGAHHLNLFQQPQTRQQLLAWLVG